MPSPAPRDAAATQRGLSRTPIERIDAPSPAIFQAEYVRPRRPVVLRGLADGWPAREWTLERLAGEFASAGVPVLPMRGGRVVVDPRRGLVRHTLPFGEFAAAMREGSSAECLTARSDELPAEFERALPPPAYSQGATWRVMKCWLLPAGTVSDLHFDLADNLHTVIFGTKRFTLVHPRESACVYPNRLTDSIPNGCQVDVEAPDLARFPRFADARPLVAELEPGDTLYIPRRWWHHGRTITLALSVNHWWARGPWSAVVKSADLFKRARGISR